MNEIKIKVQKEKLSEKPISKYLTGNFLENGFGRQVNGMWSEMIYNRSFLDKIPPYTWDMNVWWGFDNEHYNSSAPFWHSGYEEIDWEIVAPLHTYKKRTHGTDSFKGYDSLQVFFDGKAAEGGIMQKGIFIKSDETYDFSIFGGYGGGYETKVTPAIAGYEDMSEKIILERKDIKIILWEEENPSNIIFSETISFKNVQEQYDIEIAATGFTGRAAIAICFSWEGAIALSWCSMMPKKTVKGWRPDVLFCFVRHLLQLFAIRVVVLQASKIGRML